MKTIIIIQHTQSVHHTNGMVGSWTDWELSELGVEQANRIGKRLKAELSEKKKKTLINIRHIAHSFDKSFSFIIFEHIRNSTS